MLPGPAEVGIEVADARLAEVVGLALREQADLVRQVVQVVVDRRGREQDDLLAFAVAAPAAVELDHRVEGQVAVGLVVAEVVALVDQDHVGVAVGLRRRTFAGPAPPCRRPGRRWWRWPVPAATSPAARPGRRRRPSGGGGRRSLRGASCRSRSCPGPRNRRSARRRSGPGCGGPS